MIDRGKIINRSTFLRVYDFDKMIFGTISPTDIDAFLDFGGKAFVIIETKYKNSPLPRGQRLALERLCDASEKGGVRSVVLVASYINKTGDIPCGSLIVREIRSKGKWKAPKNLLLTVRDAIDMFLLWHGIG